MKRHWLVPSTPFASYAQYVKATGDNAVRKAADMPAGGVIAELEASGLRGRGGAGFPTGQKWGSIAAHPCKTRTVVCNAAEGEPGTFKDRFLLRKNPYATLEGMCIAARVVDATDLYIALKDSFRPEIERVEKAHAEMGAAGVFDGLNVRIVRGPEEYLFGEEKALLNEIEGFGPLPREAHYPPYERGLFAQPGSPNPALMNNAETFAHVPSIIRHGGRDFRTVGTEDTPGTLIFTVCGDVQRPGVYEAEAGISLRKLFHALAGGPREGRTLRAALSGVASGVLTADAFDTPAEFGALAAAGGGLGSAGFIVIDDATSLPRVVQAVARFLYVESCSQCSACKTGLRIASEGLDELLEQPEENEGESLLEVERLVQGARSAPQQNRCYLPVQGAILIPSFIERFRDDFDALRRGQAPASEPYLIPKITDFREDEHRFTYDERQPFKQPDWTYTAAAWSSS